MEKRERFIQVGVTALRDPATGEFLPAVPLYIKADAVAEQEEKALACDIGKLLAQRMRAYKERCKAEGIAI